MSFASDLEQQALQQIKAVRPILLGLHKDLLEATKLAYEVNHGKIQSNGEYFRLVLENPFFSWLRPISQLIVRIDERISAKENNPTENAETIVLEAQQLLSPIFESTHPEDSTHSDSPYIQALRQNPDLAQVVETVMHHFTL